MKIVYLSGLRLPTKNAHGFQIMNMCSAFSHSGVEVELLVPWRFNLLKEEPFSFYGLKSTFKIKKLPAVDLYPLRFIPEKISGFVSLLTFFVSARVYLSFIKYDILFTRESLSRFFFMNYVYEIHMPEQMRAGGFKSRKIIAISNYIKDKLVKAGVKDDDILVAPDAVNLPLFGKISKEEAREKLGLPKDKGIVMYWGNFKLWKGVDTLAEGAKYLKNFLILIVGGTKDTDIARIKATVGGYNNVLVEGFKDQELLPIYLASSDVLVLPNTAKDENSRLFTSPLKLFEYMASERPIVASDVPSVREILNENNAVFFSPDEPKSLAEKVESIFKDKSKADSLSKRARKDVEEYTWDKRAKRLINFLND